MQIFTATEVWSDEWITSEISLVHLPVIGTFKDACNLEIQPPTPKLTAVSNNAKPSGPETYCDLTGSQ